jgi:hypothetical protein
MAPSPSPTFTLSQCRLDIARSETEGCSVPSIGVDPAKLAILAAALVAELLGAAVLLRARTTAAS